MSVAWCWNKTQVETEFLLTVQVSGAGVSADPGQARDVTEISTAEFPQLLHLFDIVMFNDV